MTNIVSLKDVSILITKGTTPSSVNCEFSKEGINFIKSESITESKHLNSLVYEHIDNVTDEKLKRSRLKVGDLLFSIAGAYLGKIGIVQSKDIPANTNQAVGIVRLNNKFANVDYVYYYFSQRHINSYINKLSAQSSQPNLNLDLLGKLEFDCKNISTQQKIANVLSSLDAKIELNNRINTELEAMAKTLYDYWFVQFNFPFDFAQGKTNTEGKPYKSSGGKMVWNEELKREIPEGWEVKMINSIIDVKDGTHDSPKPKNEGFRLITSKNLLVSGLDFENANLISEEDYLSIIKRSNVETGDILFSMIGNIGTVYKIEEKKINFAIKNVALYKTSQKNEYKNYIYMFLKSIDMERYMKNVISGSIQKFIGLNSLRNTPILSNDNYILKFNESTQSIFEKLETIKLENQHLTSLRDWLLPMLMNGQISVGVDGEMSNDVMMAAEDGVEYGK
jgi:type I restriction enzyme S subunit